MVRAKILMPISCSRSRTATEREDCETKSLWAAAFIDPSSATAMAYLSCCRRMRTPYSCSSRNCSTTAL